MGIRYVIFFGAIVATFGIPLVGAYLIASDPLNVICWFFAFLAFKTWHKQGGFSGFRSKDIKSFFRNAKEIGL